MGDPNVCELRPSGLGRRRIEMNNHINILCLKIEPGTCPRKKEESHGIFVFRADYFDYRLSHRYIYLISKHR